KKVETTKRFEELAKELKMFPTGEISYGRGDRPAMMRLIPPKWTEPWFKIYAEVGNDKDDVADLIGLLKHDDPKVRTLALAALFRREDPKLLPHLAALMKDTDKTVPDVQIRRAIAFPPKDGDLLPQDFQEQTVG